VTEHENEEASAVFRALDDANTWDEVEVATAMLDAFAKAYPNSESVWALRQFRKLVAIEHSPPYRGLLIPIKADLFDPDEFDPDEEWLRPARCPRCASRALPICYGDPSPIAIEAEKRGLVVLAGCVVPEGREWGEGWFACGTCGLQFEAEDEGGNYE